MKVAPVLVKEHLLRYWEANESGRIELVKFKYLV